jgi:TonB-dependent starch-binding outer membrane protein SusC
MGFVVLNSQEARMHSRVVRWALALGAALVPALGSAQGTGTVRGRVTEALSGAPIAEAQISIEAGASRLGALTQQNGEYSIANVPAGQHTVRVRRLGFEAARLDVTVTSGGTAEANFSLSTASTTLGEVVVTGTAAPTERRAVGTSIASIDATAIQKSQAVTIDQALQGKIAGAQITQNSGNPGGGGISVRLRGTSSFISGSDPLYIVDGVIVDNSSGTARDLGQRSNVQNRLADLNPADIERIEVVRGAAAAALYGSRANNGVVQIFTRRGAVGKPRLTLSSRYATNELRKRIPINKYPFDAAGLPAKRFDYQDELFDRGDLTEGNLQAEGGTEQTRYFLSGAWTNETGILKSTGSERKSGRVNLTQQLYPKLRVDLGANFVNTHNDFQVNGEGNGVITAFLFTPTNYSFFPVNGVYPISPVSSANPLLMIDRFKNPQDINRFIGSAHAHFTPFKSVTADYTLGYDGYSMEQREFIPRGAFASGGNANGLSADVVRGSRIINQDAVATHAWVGPAQLGFTTTAGVNYTSQEIRTTSAASLDLAPISDVVSAGATPSAAQSIIDLVTLGFYAQEALSWRDKFYVTGALRWDASSTFGPDERWQLFPKLSGSYVISEESWWANSFLGNALSSARLRAALGYAGNQPSVLNAYQRFDTYVPTAFDGKPGLVNDVTLGNDQLKPERQRELEIGGDFGILNDRVAIEATYYNKRVDGLLFFRPVATSTGFSRQFADIGSMSNKGLELLLRSTNVQTKSFQWDMTATYTRNKNTVATLSVPDFQSASGYPNRIKKGDPVGVFYGQYATRNCVTGAPLLDSIGRQRGSQNGLPADIAGRRAISGGTCNDSLSKILGDPNPDWLGSLLNEVTIAKKLRLRMLLDGSFGNDVMNLTKRIQDLGAASNGLDAERELLPYGDPRKLAPGYLARRLSLFSEYVEDGTFVKMRELSASYTLDWGPIKKWFSQGIDLTVAGRNLFVWTDYTGYDPELNLFGQNPERTGATAADRGFDFANYPIPRSWTVSARITY